MKSHYVPHPQKLMQEATCIIPHQKFVELINTLFKWFIFLHEQLGMLFQVEDVETVCRWNNGKLLFVEKTWWKKVSKRVDS